MRLSQLIHVLKESGFCVDRVRLLEFLLRHSWLKVFAFRFLRLRFSPQLIENAESLSVELDRKQELFSLACSFINVGRTYKTTSAARTILADKAVLQYAGEHEKPCLLEVGVSDGSSSLELLKRISSFGEVKLTDRHNAFYQWRFPFGRLYYDGDRCFLGLKFLFFYLNMPTRNQSGRPGLKPITTTNPVLRVEHELAVEQFNLFTDCYPQRFHIIKCANLLTRTYFSDSEIVEGVRNLGRSLADGGRMVLSHNSDVYDEGEALTVFVRSGTQLCLEANVNNSPLAQVFQNKSVELNDLAECGGVLGVSMFQL